MNQTSKVLASVLGAASLWAAQPAAAQSILLPATPEKGVWVEAARPSMELFELSGTTSVWFLSGRLPVGERLRLVADLPYAYARLSGGELQQLFGSEGSRVVGNPLLGVEYLASPALRLELSARAPLTSANDSSFADVIGAFGEPHRAEAFAMDVVPVTGAATYERALAGGFSVRTRGAVTAMFDTADEGAEDGSETALDYGVLGGYAAGPARFGVGVAGRWLATADEGDFQDNSLHQLGLSADVRLGGVRPGISWRLPLDEEYRQIVKSSLGVYLQVPLR